MCVHFYVLCYISLIGGRIDTAHHANNAFRALNETVALSDAVQKAVDMTSEDDTLIILTSDHSHVFSVAGYPARNADIFGMSHSALYNYILTRGLQSYTMQHLNALE